MQTIAVLIPTYNRPKMLKECIESVLKQTYPYFMIYIVNDGGVEDTNEIINKFKSDKIIYTYNPINHGIAYTRNVLLTMCQVTIQKMKLCCFIDDDDLMNIHRLENQYNAIKDNPDSYVIGNARIFRDNQKVDITENSYSTDKQMAFASMLFWNKDLPIFDEKICNSGGEDTAWVKQLKQKRIELNSINYYIRLHDNRIGINKRNIVK